MNNIILKASAGTGKTYRLSLEFIANLIRGVNYKNIVVMTFTKKATAEIKERIFYFLYQIAFDKGNGAELEKNLKEIYKFDNLNKKELQNIYFEMNLYSLKSMENHSKIVNVFSKNHSHQDTKNVDLLLK